MMKLVTVLALPGILVLLCTLVNASTSASHLHHDQGSCYLPFPTHLIMLMRLLIIHYSIPSTSLRSKLLYDLSSTGLSEKLSEVANRDVIYLSMKQVTPRRRARPAKETLLSIESALSEQNHRFSLHVDRRTKRGA